MNNINKIKMRMLNFRQIFIGLSIVTIVVTASGQKDTIDVNDITREQILKMSDNELFELPFEVLVKLASKLGLTVDELLNMQVTVGTQTRLTPRETPGIVTVITEDEIRKSGARDLVDVLKLVPGISFGYDLDGALGLAMRGNWGYEGKILFLLDGQEMNEGLYSTANVGRHYPVENLERIEIIRGAGSAFYGGYAELGVINIITRDADKINGVTGSFSYGLLSPVSGHATAQVSAGVREKETALTIHGFYGGGNRSNATITDFYGDEYDLSETFSHYTEKNLNLGLESKIINLRFIYDDYKSNITQYSDDAVNRFQNILGEINQEFEISNKLSVTPRLRIKNQLPYNLEEEDWFYKKRISRINGNVNLKYDSRKKFDILGGIDYYTDIARDKDDDPETVFFPDETEEISFHNVAFFIQGLYKARVFNLIAGGRVDYHTQAGAAFSPRVGITGIINAFHYKLLYSQAFRSPSVENISLNPDIVPEKTSMIELETGFRLTSNIFLTANIFDITIKDPIVYIYFPGTEEQDYSDESEAYENFSRTGTRGLEVECKTVYNRFFANINYSFYTAAGKNKVLVYDAINENLSVNRNALQGFPQHKFSFHGGYNILDNLIISVNAVWEGEKYGMFESDSVQSLLSSTLSLNAFIEFREIAGTGLSAGLGVHNILDEDIWFIQPYGSSGNAYYPYPDAGREIMFRLRYDLKFK